MHFWESPRKLEILVPQHYNNGRSDTKIKDFLQSVTHSSFCGAIFCLLALLLKDKLGVTVPQLISK